MQQKVQFISSILHEPEHHDPGRAVQRSRPDQPAGAARTSSSSSSSAGKTIIFSTHIIEHAERICDHVCIMAKGRKVADGTVAGVKTEHGGEYVAITFETWSANARHRGEALAGRRLRAREWQHARSRDESKRRIRSSCCKSWLPAGLRLKRFEWTEPSLEQVFLERVGASEEIMREMRSAEHV